MARPTKPSQSKPKAETWVIIGIGGHIKQVEIDKLELSIEDDEYDITTFDSFRDYVDYCVEEAVAEFEQHFARAVALKKSDALTLLEKLPPLLM